MMRFKLILLFVLFLTLNTDAQDYFELGGFVGFANYQGDLANDPIEFGETKYSFGGFASYHYNARLHLRAQLYYGRISGDDANKVERSARPRLWRFNADIYEASIQVEYLPFAKPRIDKVGLFHPQINPFLTFGVGTAFANKELDTSNTKWIMETGEGGDLTVEVNEPDDRDNFLVFPVGAGLRFDFTQWSTFAMEFGWRYTQSDYIDGVSLNGKAGGPDWYFFVGLTLSTYFGQQEDYGF